MQEIRISESRKLMFGLCLLLLLGMAMCASISADDEDTLKKRITSEIDEVFNEDLICPSGVANEVKTCVMPKGKLVSGAYCMVFKKVWDCLKLGLLKCQYGTSFVELVGPRINYVALSHGCPAVTTSVTIPQYNFNGINGDTRVTDQNMVNTKFQDLPDTSRKTVIFWFSFVIFLVCLFCCLISKCCGNRSSEAQAGATLSTVLVKNEK